jgi:bacterioferritin-associated ferredoxin
MGRKLRMITKCICFDTDFTTILVQAKLNNWSYEDVEKHLGCGSACGMCIEYIKACLLTEQTSFEYVKYKPN